MSGAPSNSTGPIVHAASENVATAVGALRYWTAAMYAPDRTNMEVSLTSKALNGNVLIVHDSVAFTEFNRRIEDSYGWRFAVAKRVVRSLRRKEKYFEVFTDYLQGGMSKDEFRKAVEAFVVTPREVSDSVSRECRFATELVGEGALDASELSVLLDLDTIQLESFLRCNEPLAIEQRS